MRKPELMRKLTINKDEAIVAVIDYQEHIVPAMNGGAEAVAAAAKFIKGCRVLGVPTIVTQQYTKGLGETVEPIREALEKFIPIEKNTFSAAGNEDFMAMLETWDRDTVVIIGIEAHVCVEQTALALLREGYDVFVITDCIASRHERDRKEAERRMIHAGVTLTTCEAALFEMLGGAGEPGFKEISAIVK